MNPNPLVTLRDTWARMSKLTKKGIIPALGLLLAAGDMTYRNSVRNGREQQPSWLHKVTSALKAITAPPKPPK